MPHIKLFSHISKSDVAIAGGKGASLGEMSRLRLGYAGQADYVNPVPAGFIVLASAFDRFIEETNLKEEIEARLSEVNPEDTNTVDRASNVLRDVIHDTAMPEDLAEEIWEAFDELFANTPSSDETSPRAPLLRGEGGNQFVAVRSSATAEDSAVASWAGELETYLNTTRENVVERVKNCWSSLFTPRAIFYRHEKKLIDHYVSVAVVIQKMIQSEISGIAFTVHPVTEDPDQMIIEAGFGLGEAIVSGQITPDSYVVLKNDMSIMDINIGIQTRKLVKSKIINHKPARHGLARGMAGGSKITNKEDDYSNEWVEVGSEGEKQKLSGKQIIEVAKICKQIEEHYGFPCDIEWAIEGGKIYITQSRPITTLKSKDCV